MTPRAPSAAWLAELVARALLEDVGHGDVTTDAIVSDGARGTGLLLARGPIVVCGIPVLETVFAAVDPRLKVEPIRAEGAHSPGADDPILRIQGPLRGLLTGERVALNFLQRLSGIATRTARFVALLGDRSTRLVDTRKTTPGLRALERYAVQVGGARNHRFHLADGVLIKDNHIAAAGGITFAIKAALAHAHHLLQIEVEVESLRDAHEAVDAGARVLLLDNFSVPALAEAVRSLRERPESLILEASGNVDERSLVAIADCGVDVISSGGLIHQATWVDISLEITRE